MVGRRSEIGRGTRRGLPLVMIFAAAILLVMVVIPAATAGYSSTVLGDSPTAYWRLDETATTSGAADSSGNGLAGQYTGNITLGVAGALSGDSDTAALLGPSTSTQAAGSVDVPYAQALDPSSGDFSFEMFVKTTSTASGQVIAAEGTGDASSGCMSGPGWMLRDDGGAVSVEIDFAGATLAPTTCLATTGQVVAQGPMGSTISDGAWHFVAVTVCRSCGTVEVWVDGNDQTTVASLTGSLSNGDDLQLGGALANSNLYVPFNGAVDEAAYYNYDLTDNQVALHYGASLGSDGSSGGGVTTTTSSGGPSGGTGTNLGGDGGPAGSGTSSSSTGHTYGGYGTTGKVSGSQVSILATGSWSTSAAHCVLFWTGVGTSTVSLQAGLYRCFGNVTLDKTCVTTNNAVQMYVEKWVAGTTPNPYTCVNEGSPAGVARTFKVQLSNSQWHAWVNGKDTGVILNSTQTMQAETTGEWAGTCSQSFTASAKFGSASPVWQTYNGSSWATPSSYGQLSNACNWKLSGSVSSSWTASD